MYFISRFFIADNKDFAFALCYLCRFVHTMRYKIKHRYFYLAAGGGMRPCYYIR